MNFTRVAAAAALLAVVGLAGCDTASKAFGLSKVTPDEFRVVHGFRVTVQQYYFVPRRSSRLQQEHPQMWHEVASNAIVRIMEQNFHKRCRLVRRQC